MGTSLGMFDKPFLALQVKTKNQTLYEAQQIAGGWLMCYAFHDFSVRKQTAHSIFDCRLNLKYNASLVRH